MTLDTPVRAMEERNIQAKWVEETIAGPALRASDPDDAELERFYMRIPESGNRSLTGSCERSRIPLA